MSKKTLLLVEKDPVAADRIVQRLSGSTYEIVHLTDAQSAIQRTVSPLETSIDLVLMCIDLDDDYGGIDASLGILKHRDIPIIFLCSEDETSLIDRAAGIQSYGFVLKDSGTIILDAAIRMAFNLFSANRELAQELAHRRQFEKTLRESEERYKTIVSSMSDIIFVIDKDERFIDVHSHSTEDLFVEPRLFLGRALPDVLPPGVQSLYLEAARKVRQSASNQRYEYSLDIRGEKRWFMASLDLHEDGQTIVAGIREITERKVAEEALVKSQEQLDLFFSQSLHGFFIMLLDEPLEWSDSIDKERALDYVFDNMRLTKANQAMLDQYGAREDDMLGITPRDFFSHDIDAGRRAIRNLFDLGRSNIQTNEVRLDGTPIIIEGDYICFYDTDGRITGHFGVQTDVTERRKAEEERERLQAQLIQAQKMESIGRLAGGVAHDFNNMLSVILGRTQIALSEVDPSSLTYDDLNEIRKAAEHSAGVTRQLLAFARKQTVTPEALDLNAAVEEILNMLRRVIGEGIELQWLPGTDLPPIFVDPTQVDQILANLCVNAKDAISYSGRITIETEFARLDPEFCCKNTEFIPGDYIVLHVMDDGCGMDNEIQAHIFEPFFTTKDKGKGTGLGLATVYGIVRQNNGFLKVQSEPGKGTRFSMYFPAHTAADHKCVRVEAPKKIDKHSGATILLVEDEPAILKTTSILLGKLGYRVLVALSPIEAIEVARTYDGNIDLLITDVIMPEMNGKDLASRLMEYNTGMKRLFMSGYPDDVIAPHGVLDPSVHFLQKPFSISLLCKKISETLSST